jgi:hypothetical protein
MGDASELDASSFCCRQMFRVMEAPMRDMVDRPKARRSAPRPLSTAQNGASSAATERWETYITILQADASEQADYLARTWPEVTFPRYAVQSLIPPLDALGAQGWEPVSIQPVVVGINGDIATPEHPAMYSHQYLCVFKRRRQQ